MSGTTLSSVLAKGDQQSVGYQTVSDNMHQSKKSIYGSGTPQVEVEENNK